MPASTTPTGTTKLSVEGLGEVEGFTFPAGVRQFSGIPYATLTKRWTRSQLNTSWPDNFHNGTKLGYVLSMSQIKVHTDSPVADAEALNLQSTTLAPVWTLLFL